MTAKEINMIIQEREDREKTRREEAYCAFLKAQDKELYDAMLDYEYGIQHQFDEDGCF